MRYTLDHISRRKRSSTLSYFRIRIGIGFWAYDNAGTPYHSGADTYLSKAIQWAKNAGLLVTIELHGAPGSQNGDVNSGHVGSWEVCVEPLLHCGMVLTDSSSVADRRRKPRLHD